MNGRKYLFPLLMIVVAIALSGYLIIGRMQRRLPASSSNPVVNHGGSARESGVDIETYLTWFRAGDSRRVKFIQAQIEQRGDEWAQHNDGPFPLLERSELSVPYLKTKQIRLEQAEGGPVDLWLVSWPEQMVNEYADDETTPVYGCALEIFVARASGIELAARHLFDNDPKDNPESADSVSPHVLDHRWLYFRLYDFPSILGTGMAGEFVSWYQATASGLRRVWRNDHWATDANTSWWIQSGTLGDEKTAVLNGRPAIFVDRYKIIYDYRDGGPAARHRDRLTRKVSYRGMAVLTQPADLQPFQIDERYSGLTANEAAEAAMTGSRETLFDEKSVDGIDKAGAFLRLESR